MFAFETARSKIFLQTNGLRWRRGLIGALAAMESLMLTSSRVFSHATTMEFQRSYVVFRTCLNKLATHAYEKKLLRYHFRPKLHQLGHLVYHFLPKNPRYYSCYVDEDFVSRTKQLALKCHPLFVSQQVCFRYSLRMCLSWAGQV